MVFNSCTRYVFNLHRYDHLSTRRNELLGVPFFDYYEFRALSFFFKLILTQRLVISLLTLLVRTLLELLTLFFHQAVRGLRCWLGEFVCEINCRWLLRMSIRFERAVMERMRTILT
jgi:hypothetical protein